MRTEFPFAFLLAKACYEKKQKLVKFSKDYSQSFLYEYLCFSKHYRMKVSSKKIFTLLFWLWLILICILMFRPSSDFPTINIVGLDKVVHFSLFGILGFLFIAKSRTKPNTLKAHFKLIDSYVLLLFSIGIEFLQTLSSTRSFELLDILANVTGLFAGLVLGSFTFTYFKKTNS